LDTTAAVILESRLVKARLPEKGLSVIGVPVPLASSAAQVRRFGGISDARHALSRDAGERVHVVADCDDGGGSVRLAPCVESAATSEKLVRGPLPVCHYHLRRSARAIRTARTARGPPSLRTVRMTSQARSQ